jgi:hypothetical protein
VLFMVEVHVLDGWLAPGAGASGGGWYHALRLLGGLAAPAFLYMAGISQALADASLAAKGVPASGRRRSALRRALWLLGVAYAFRAVEFVVGGAWSVPGGWQDVLRVDILNVIAVGLALSALLSIGVPRGWGAGLTAAAAAAAVLLTPIAAEWTRPSPELLGRLFDYVHGTWPRSQFHLLNWAGFLLAGAALAPLAAGRSRPLAFLALGAALYWGGWAGDRLPPVYAHQDFWKTSPSWFAMRLGLCVGLTGALQLVPAAAERGLRWLSTMGRQSLVGYIASVELTYGVLAHPLRNALSFEATVLGMVAMAAVTWAISVAWERLKARRKARPGPAAPPAAAA